MAARFVDDSINLILMMNGIPYATPKRLVKTGIGLVRYGTLPINRKVVSEELADEWAETRKSKKRFTKVRAKFDEYNKRLKERGDRELSWSTIAKKGINIIKAEKAT